MNSYQKLKKKNKDLLSDIAVLVQDNNFMATQELIAKYRMMFGMAEQVLFGSRNIEFKKRLCNK